MINFKQREAILPSAMIVFSIVLLVGTVAFMVIVPTPTAAGTAKMRTRDRQKIEDDISSAKQRTSELDKENSPRLWTSDPETVTAAVLAQMTTETGHRSLKLGAFRPQKPQTLEGMTELPFSIQIAGPYDQIRSVVAILDADSSKLAVRSVQIAASDAASSAVTATLSVSAYLPATLIADSKSPAKDAGVTKQASAAGATEARTTSGGSK